ncbi:MAG TPA: hybrid sensor histidine kinase/response regulator [Polyangia bacterium]|jgi:signal transduction histidine kinase
MPANATGNLLVGLPADPLLLVVDADEEGRHEILAALSGARMRVVEATTGTEALAKVESDTPDLVILALSLPDTDGLHVCRQIKSKAITHLVPVVLLCHATAADPSTRIKTFTAGADQLFIRPLVRAEFLARCWSLLRTRGLIRALEKRRQELHLRSDFARFLVHDLRGPLTCAVSGVEFLQQEAYPEYDKSEEARALSDVAHELRRMGAMIQDLLDVDRFERGALELEKSPVRLGELLSDLKRQFHRQCQERSTPLWLEGDTSVEVEADRALLFRVLDNLIGNGLRYSPKGQAVIVDVGTEGNQVRVAVINRGPTIPAQERGAIFEPFVRLSGATLPSGAGLGLAFCRLVVAAHGGRIFVEDAPGGGIAFVFTLPRSQAG